MPFQKVNNPQTDHFKVLAFNITVQMKLYCLASQPGKAMTSKQDEQSDIYMSAESNPAMGQMNPDFTDKQ